MEDRLELKLMECRTGGDCGGESCLIEEGHDFLRRYGEVVSELQILAAKKTAGNDLMMGEENDSSSSADNQRLIPKRNACR
jgi:molybdenum-dependent DNA-binding transcriptional regulator ModE